MKKILFLLMIISDYCYGQVAGSYAYIANIKANGQLIPNTVYIIQDMGKMELMAQTCNSFYIIPYRRTPYAMEYDEELFYFDSKKLLAIDNIHCILRCANNSWFVLNDAGHIPYKVGTVTDNVILNFTKIYDRVMNFHVDIDETYAQQDDDFTVGAGVGYGNATILLYKSIIVNGVIKRVPLTKAELSITWANLWVSAKMAKYIQL